MNAPRRTFLFTTLATTALACGGQHAATASTSHEAHDADEGVTAPEDLMREHGVLRRILLAYDESARRLRARQELDPAVLARAARLVQTFVEGYHELSEERYVFPPLREVTAVSATVQTLLVQHARGREVTAEILRRTAPGPASGSEAALQLAALCEAFTRMYRPHAAREDSVVFPALRATLGKHRIDELGERMEEMEHSTVGEGGFEHAVDDVAQIERALGIEDLARFTPTVADVLANAARGGA